MKYKLNEIIPYELTQDATDFVNSIEGNYYLEDYELDENGNMQLIVRQLVFPDPTPEEIQANYTRLIQSILDNEAYKLGYTGANESVEGACNSVCTYIETGNQKFDSEGRAFRSWRSAVWQKGYEILALVKAGEMEIPSQEELLEMLPKLEIIYSD